MFLVGICATGRATIGFVYFVEFLPEDKKSYYGTLVNVIEGLTLIAVSLILAYATKSTAPFLIYAITCHLVVNIVSLFVPESPSFLAGKKRYAEARKVLDQISTFNGYGPYTSKFKAELPYMAPSPVSPNTEVVELTGSLKEFLSVRTYLINLIVMIGVWVVSSFDYYMISFELKYI